jgi:uncharacterized protein YacL
MDDASRQRAEPLNDVSLPPAAREAETLRASLVRIARLAFFAVFVVVTTLSVLYFQPDKAVPKDWPRVAGVILAISIVIASIVGAVDLLTRKKKIGAVIAVFFGIAAAMLATAAIGSLFDLLASLYEIDARITSASKVLLGIGLAYLAVTTILQTQDDFRLVIPYVEFAKQIRGSKPLILDSSALIDGRIVDVAASALVQSPIVIPRFVVLELQKLADSADKLVRTKGRRGLDMVTRLQRLGTVAVSIDELPVPGKTVDQMLIEFGRLSPGVIVTTDLALARIAEIQQIGCINMHELANALKPALVPGETHLVGERAELVVSSSLQTAAGRLLFAKLAHRGSEGVEAMGASAPDATGAEARGDSVPGGDGVSGEIIEPDASAADAGEPSHEAESGTNGASHGVTGGGAKPVRSPYPPNPPRSIRSGTPRNPRR